MKITINTKEDSKEEIRKVINLLSNIVKEDQVHSNTDLFSASKDVFSGTRAEINTCNESSTNNYSTSDISNTPSSSNPPTNNQNAFANMFGESTAETTTEPTIDLANLSNLRENKEEPEEEEDVKVISY